MLFKLSNLNSNLVLTLNYLKPALNNSALGITAVPREIENKAYAEFGAEGGGANKLHYGRCASNVFLGR